MLMERHVLYMIVLDLTTGNYYAFILIGASSWKYKIQMHFDGNVGLKKFYSNWFQV